MRAFAAIAVGVILLALGFSVLLLPSREEVGTMLLRDRQYEDSRSEFEALLDRGDVSIQTISALLRIYVQYGDVDRAVDLVERYRDVAGRSPDIVAQLVELHRKNRKFGLYLRWLDTLVDIEPTPERLADLIDAHFRRGDKRAQLAALERLHEKGWHDADRLVEMSELQILFGDHDGAIATLLELRGLGDERLDWSQRLVLTELLLRQGQADQAWSLISTWLDASAPAYVPAAFAQSLIAADREDAAIDVLQARPDLETVHEPWRSTLVFALRRADRDPEAKLFLDSWWDSPLFPVQSASDYIDLCVQARELDKALAVIDRVGVSMTGAAAAVGLIDALYRTGRMEDVDRLLAEIGDEVLTALPVLGAEIALARGDPGRAAHFVDLALAGRQLALGERVALAEILRRLDRDREAFELLRAVVADPEFPVEGMLVLGDLYLALDLAEEGYWDLTSLLARRNTPRLRAVWAQLALLTDRRPVVLDWLARERSIEAAALTDMYFVAERREDWPVATAAARRLFEADPTDERRERLAYALYRDGRSEEALGLLTPLIGERTDLEGLYADILRELGRIEDLVALWLRQLARDDLSVADREGLVYALLEVGADAPAWNALLDLARDEGGSWWFTLARSADRLGRVSELASEVTRQVEHVDPASPSASAMVFGLSDLDRRAALPALRSLARRDATRWEETYLATLRDLEETAELVAWISEKLAATSDADKALELAYVLVEVATAPNAAETLRSWADRTRPFAELYAETLRRAGQTGRALGFEVEMARSGRFGADYADGVAFRALESGDKKTAEALLRVRAAAAKPDSPLMQQLYFLWGPRPRSDIIDWIAERAARAAGDERTAWLGKLADFRAGATVDRLIGGVEGARNDQEMLLLVRARADGKDREALRKAIEAAIGRISKPSTLKTLARQAEATRDRGLITRAWTAVLKSDPRDPDALRTLGLIAYDEGRLIDAERMLGSYLAKGEGDYEANYFYGDTLYRTKRQPQSIPFFKKAMSQLEALPKPGFQDQVARANTLRRLGRQEEAIALMERLLKDRPKDRALRADLADLLIERGDLRRARSVLQMKQ